MMVLLNLMILECMRELTQVKESYKCEICDDGFTKLDDFKVHKRIHKTFWCYMCGKCFIDSSNLKMHEGVHTGLQFGFSNVKLVLNLLLLQVIWGCIKEFTQGK